MIIRICLAFAFIVVNAPSAKAQVDLCFLGPAPGPSSVNPTLVHTTTYDFVDSLLGITLTHESFLTGPTQDIETVVLSRAAGTFPVAPLFQPITNPRTYVIGLTASGIHTLDGESQIEGVIVSGGTDLVPITRSDECSAVAFLAPGS